VVVPNWELRWLFPIGNLGCCSQLGTWVVVPNWAEVFSVVVFQGKKALWYCNLLEVVFMFPIISEGWGGRGERGERE